jgi:hypothetical protein
MDDHLDQHVEDRINSGYGDILDELNALDCQEPSAFDEPWDRHPGTARTRRLRAG